MGVRTRPFSQGTQYMDWNEANCCRCRKYHVASDGQIASPICELEEALSIACVLDGTISPEHAERLGVPENTWSDWRCREFEPKSLPEDTPHHKPAKGQLELFA